MIIINSHRFGPPPPYVPPTPPINPVVWSTADSITGKNNGDALTTWADTGSNGYAWTASASPQYRSTEGPNGLPCLLMDITTGVMIGNAGVGTAMNAGTAGEVFMVVKAAASSGDSASWKWGISGNSPHYHFGNANTYYDDSLRTDRTGYTSQWDMTAWTLVNFSMSAGVWTARANSTLWTTDTGKTFSCRPQPILGASDIYNNTGFRMAEVACFSRALTGQERSDMESLLNTKYNLW